LYFFGNENKQDDHLANTNRPGLYPKALALSYGSWCRWVASDDQVLAGAGGDN
jgi:hypothetical protein